MAACNVKKFPSHVRLEALLRVAAGDAPTTVARAMGLNKGRVVDWAREAKLIGERKPRAKPVKRHKPPCDLMQTTKQNKPVTHEPKAACHDYMVYRRSERGELEYVHIDVVNGQWPSGTFKIKRRKARHVD